MIFAFVIEFQEGEPTSLIMEEKSVMSLPLKI